MKAKFTKIKKLLLPQARFTPMVLVLVGVALLFVGYPANAGLQSLLANYLILPIAEFFGGLTLTLIGILVQVAQYNNFIDVPAVQKGWILLRDVTNMLFIVILLLIAFGTLFRWENYHYKKLLGKLLIMAVLVNFSKGITGFMIDFAQVLMLTFVYGFADSAAGNFVQGFHLDKMFQFASNNLTPEEARNLEADETSFLIAAILALTSIFVAMVVIGVIVVVLIFRVVALWFLVITSPIAYTLNIFPGQGQKYAQMWWDYFGRYASSGPILAFFLWLSLSVMQITGGETFAFTQSNNSADLALGDIPAAAITGIGQSDILLSFIVNISLLIGALWMTKQMGVAGGNMAGSAMGYLQKGGAAIVKAPFKASWGAAKLSAKAFNQSLVKNTGVSLDVRDYGKAFKVAREDRRKEAYQDFYAHKEQFFKEWGTPTGALKKIFGAGFRQAGKSKISTLSEEKKRLEAELSHGHKGARYQEQLHKEQAVLQKELVTIEQEEKKNLSGSEKEELQLRKQKVVDRNAKVEDLLKKDQGELSAEYSKELTKQLNHVQKQLRTYGAYATLSDDNIIDVRIKEVDDDVDLINSEIQHNEIYSQSLKELKNGTVEPETVLQTKLNDVRTDLVTVRADKAAAESSGDLKKVKQLEHKEDKLALQERLIEKVQIPYAQKQEQYKLADTEYKDITSRIKNTKNSLEVAKKNNDKDEMARLSIAINNLTTDQEKKKEEKEELKKEMEKLSGSPQQVDTRMAELHAKTGELEQQRLIRQQEKEKIVSAPASDAKLIAEEIKKGWESLRQQAKTQAEKINAEITARDLNKSDQAQHAKKLSQIEEQINKIKTGWYQTSEPASYYIEQERRRNMAEELKKITSENPEELTSEFKKAVASGNNARAKALVMKLTNDYNLNDLMNAYGEKSNFEGLNNFREKVLIGELHLDPQEALQFQNDVSYAAENVGHWASARTVGFDVAKEKYYALDEEEHTKIALAEIMKMQPRQIVSSLNRLAYGGERPKPEGGVSFEIDKLGQAIVMAAQNVIAKEIGHMQINSATNLSQPQSMAVLRELADQGKIDTSILRLIQSRVSSGMERTPNELVNYLMKGILH